MADITRMLTSIVCFLCAWMLAVPLPASAGSVPEGYELQIALDSVKLPDARRELTATVTATREDTAVPVEGLMVNFFAGSVGRDGGWGNVTTDAQGVATKLIDADAKIPLNENGKLVFFARSKVPDMPFLEATVEVADATIELATVEEIVAPEEPEEPEEGEGTDGEAEPPKPTKFIEASLVSHAGGEPAPMAGVKVDFEIVRSFGNIGFGGDFTYTDEQGKVRVEFPEDIPQNADGEVVVAAKLADEEHGTVVQQIAVPWGQPIVRADPDARALWASRAQAPWWLIISANLMLAGVWGMVLYVLNLTRRIKRG